MINILENGLFGASLKVKRAYRHIDELKFTIDEIGRANPDLLAVRKQQDSSAIIGFTDLGPLFIGLPLIIGDVIHNLRAALDHSWVAFSLAASPAERRNLSAVKFVTFPFHEARKDVEAAVEKGPIKQAFPKTEELILEHIKPHRDEGGDEVFWTITKFDKIDKHNMIVPTFRQYTVRDTTIRSGGTTIHLGNIQMTNCVQLGSFAGPVEYEQKGKTTVEVIFPEDGLLPGQPVLPTLLNMAEATANAVELFQKEFVGA